MQTPAYPLKLRTLSYAEQGRNYQVEKHSHNVHQIYLVLHGQVRYYLDGQEFDLDPEDLVLISPGKERSPRCGKKAPGYFNAIFENTGLDFSGACDRKLALPEELRPDLHALIGELRAIGGADTDRNAMAAATQRTARVTTPAVRRNLR